MEIPIRPLTGFGTPLKGDTLFGQFCWQAANDSSILSGGLDHWISRYPEKPFAVFSSAFPKLGTSYAFPRPLLPNRYLSTSTQVGRIERIRERKDEKRKQWILVDEDLVIKLAPGLLRTSDELFEGFDAEWVFPVEQNHNTINRSTGTTGTGQFAPFSTTVWFYRPEVELVLFVLYDPEAATIEGVASAVERIGLQGFGRDASSGAGRFTVGQPQAIDYPEIEAADALYALSPVVPVAELYSTVYHTPFVRFGRHGDRLAVSNHPFKNPVITADEGAVLIAMDPSTIGQRYAGCAVRGVSKAMENTVMQGYSICLPLKLGRKE